ncbi:MAG TPA: hypothetical protein VJZ71_17255 [Phycisphaerae bacterium]|nr:hypothetical protein [Phycisphaerae bacterium]
MIFALVISLAAPILAAYALVRAVGPPDSHHRANLAMRWPLAVGLGLGLASSSYFLWRVFFGDTGGTYQITESAIYLIAAGVLWCKKGPRMVADEPPSLAASLVLRRIVQISCLLGIPVCVAALIIMLLAAPHGEWDGWAIWNMRARFLFRGGEHWRDAFDPRLSWSHPDYPLLLPGAIARSWAYVGRESTVVPATIAILFALATAGLVAGVIAKLRGATTGLLAGLVLLSTDYYLRHGAYQYADTPLSFFILATLALTFLHARRPDQEPGLLALAGLCAACAAWTKNEGLLFLLCWVVALWLARILPGPRGSRGRLLLAWIAGLVPIAAIIIYFKVTLAPDNDLAAAFSAQKMLAYLADPARYTTIARFFGKALLEFGKSVGPLLAIYWLLVGRSHQPSDRRGLTCCLVVVGLMSAGYFSIYLLTPLDLVWHLKTSGHRLILQLFPAALLLVFTSAAGLDSPGGPAK